MGRFCLINTLFCADDQWSGARDMSTNRWTDLFRPLCVHQALAPPLGKEVGGWTEGEEIKKKDVKVVREGGTQVEIKGMKGGAAAEDHRGVWHVQSG